MPRNPLGVRFSRAERRFYVLGLEYGRTTRLQSTLNLELLEIDQVASIGTL
jgi:hypothetical protein